jgi:hypothetical protein
MKKRPEEIFRIHGGQLRMSEAMLNSRMKDFNDIWLLSRKFDFDGAKLAEAIRPTFKRRGTRLPLEIEAFASLRSCATLTKGPIRFCLQAEALLLILPSQRISKKTLSLCASVRDNKKIISRIPQCRRDNRDEIKKSSDLLDKTPKFV